MSSKKVFMEKQTIRLFNLTFSLICLVLFISVECQAQELTIRNIELGAPEPGIPFYHFKADLSLPKASIIEVEAIVNGKVLRATDLYKAGQKGDPSLPPLTHRPPSGYGLANDGTLYKDPTVVGWVKWTPGTSYEIKLTVRLKETAKGSEKDPRLTASRKVVAPQVPVFDEAWKSYKSIVLSETAGIDRNSEPVEVLLGFYPDEVNDLKRDKEALTSEFERIKGQTIMDHSNKVRYIASSEHKQANGNSMGKPSK